MDIYVLNRNFEIEGIVDGYKSVIWTTRYFTPGDFELYLPATDEYINLLKEDYYLCRDRDITDTEFHNVMIISKIEIQTSIEDGDYMIVSGKCLKSLMKRRIIWKQTNMVGKLEYCIRRVLTENIIQPNIAERKISNFILGPMRGFPETLDIQITGDTILKFLQDVCETAGIGWDIYIQKNNFVFVLYKGENRSYNQDKNPHVVFSKEFDNMISSDYVLEKEDYCNVALVAGEGEGLDRRTTIVGNAAGIDRYELYVDARDVSSNNGEITDSEYMNSLAEKGNEKLAEVGIKEFYEGSIETLGNFLYGEDYFLGDIVSVINQFGMEAAPRIIEIVDNEDETGRKTIPTFSSWEV
ncbi:hypothetical protein GKG47_14045 [Lactonifactor sp. BIOML-A3]|uniref:siphovirus ReqiPepy6 Gp37-like family protein n=1 Tax=unclassified Lactonifactor TaxID=2636670 RepID=UPI0012B15F6B|nr:MULTISPECIES: siphovirus ReqiPepy6 Gp37-like family protein [unclassified Lactonifactor]MSA02904.1 hypothetical protein [Lactonifactor sp. BIOML-A5]MSA10263.1 hypothetical protein [Lactonifactor sp. BIOML-A4]MSA13551.1 hypothetical protein [Lactonifactor sp. BIOML-A3]MSA19236.1 hypothetical protein [Lactonifactor sp. BIOML-A2]MSA39105.1 hypothetical protein [Lactonifactor sp. BIOML-A1]